jgi:hypothetical protein
MLPLTLRSAAASRAPQSVLLEATEVVQWAGRSLPDPGFDIALRSMLRPGLSSIPFRLPFAVSAGFKYQRFTLSVARAMQDRDAVDRHPAGVPAVQRVMTPVWLGLATIIGYALLAIAAFLGFSAWGWAWLAICAVLALFAPAIMTSLLPWPSRAACVRMSTAEVHRAMGEATDRRDRARQQLCSAVIIELMRV